MKTAIAIIATMGSLTFAGESAEVRFKSIDTQSLIAATLILEAGGESHPYAMQAVHEVIVNRSHSSNQLQRQVILRPRQFSCWNGSYEDKMRRYEIARNHARYMEAYHLAKTRAYRQQVSQGADHYHTIRVNPSWNRKMTRTVIIGNHVFYRD